MLAVDSLSFGYRREEPIFTGTSLRFEPGAVTVVTGRSGCGKSTLLYLLGLLLSPWQGRVVLGGVEVSGLSDWDRSRLRAARIGFVFQDAVLDPSRSVIDNVSEAGLYSGMTRREARRVGLGLLEGFEVALRADHRPGEVSGGQAQRVALCRALVNRPEVILADEPTGNLDRQSADVVLVALADAAHSDGATVVVASHDPEVAARADRVVSLDA
ncbi:MAG: ATP-binding cassette domain-containing protein [Actinobacteria bacterium]|nr:ATP-binding cassette domain-containing protein [Actinomycetota bacterium]